MEVQLPGPVEGRGRWARVDLSVDQLVHNVLGFQSSPWNRIIVRKRNLALDLHQNIVNLDLPQSYSYITHSVAWLCLTVQVMMGLLSFLLTK